MLFIRYLKRLLPFLTILLMSSSAAALNVPALQSHVNDYAGMIDSTIRGQLETRLSDLEKSDSTQIVVLTIPSLEGEVLDQFALKVLETWKIGQKGLDNGVLLLISKRDRKLRIEVGYGLEGSLTDLAAGRIIDHVIVPQFKQGLFSEGINRGVETIIQAVKGDFIADTPVPTTRERFEPGPILFFIFFGFSFIAKQLRNKRLPAAIVGGVAGPLLIFFFLPHIGTAFYFIAMAVGMAFGLIASSLPVSSGRRGGFYLGPGGIGGPSGGFGGGFGGGGGGGGGGGASGGW